jgi:hypothetical protein
MGKLELGKPGHAFTAEAVDLPSGAKMSITIAEPYNAQGYDLDLVEARELVKVLQEYIMENL